MDVEYCFSKKFQARKIQLGECEKAIKKFKEIKKKNNKITSFKKKHRPHT